MAGDEEPAPILQQTLCNIIFANTLNQPLYFVQGEASIYAVRLILYFLTC